MKSSILILLSDSSPARRSRRRLWISIQRVDDRHQWCIGQRLSDLRAVCHSQRIRRLPLFLIPIPDHAELLKSSRLLIGQKMMFRRSTVPSSLIGNPSTEVIPIGTGTHRRNTQVTMGGIVLPCAGTRFLMSSQKNRSFRFSKAAGSAPLTAFRPRSISAAPAIHRLSASRRHRFTPPEQTTPHVLHITALPPGICSPGLLFFLLR